MLEQQITMNNQLNKSKGPGVYIPPPFFYVLTFLASVFIQNKIPISNLFFQRTSIKVFGIFLLIGALIFLVRSLRQFFLTKNTLILIKRASSLQTTGIYKITRNPMYVGLAFLYIGVSCFVENWWLFILFPFLILIIQEYIIKREEKYLELEFGQTFRDYRKTVRRWL